MAAAPAAIAIATAVAGTGAAAYSAHQQNRAASRARRSQREAAAIQSEQLRDRASQTLMERRRELALIRDRLQVASAETGVGFPGTLAALDRQALYDFEANQDVIGRNLDAQIGLVQSGLNASLAELDARTRNGLLEGFLGGLGGFGTGLQIGTSANQVFYQGERPGEG